MLVVNVGSSSCKLTVAADGAAREADTGDDSPRGWDAARWREFAGAQGEGFEPDFVLHRFVHGGGVFHGPTAITAQVRQRLDALVPLAPLHTANALAVADALAEAFPAATGIACFDTAFHRTLPPAVYTYAIPRSWRTDHGIRKYGFHGFAHEYADRRARELVGRPVSRVLSCHLGSGASLAAIVDGSSVDTTMGFTPIDGLVMATRPGSLDPGALAWLLSDSALSPAELSAALEHGSGLTGLVGHGDLKAVIVDAAAGDEESALAYEVWLHRLAGQMGSMIAAMGGVDLIAFGGGIGQNSWEARLAAAQPFRSFGLRLDEEANRVARADAVISSPDSPIACVVVRAREDLAMIGAASAAGVLAGRRPTSAIALDS
jgi:acetate kinase